jgi:hypothetical protein
MGTVHEQRRRPDEAGSGRFRRDAFTDWDNPEDAIEEDSEADEEGWYTPGPEDPDYDLSEAAGYAGWEPPPHSGPFPRWAVVILSILLIAAILLPVLLRVR